MNKIIGTASTAGTAGKNQFSTKMHSHDFLFLRNHVIVFLREPYPGFWLIPAVFAILFIF